MQKFNFSYDKENDDLFLFNPTAKSKGSVELGDLILDYDTKKELVGLQILNAAKLIKDLVDAGAAEIKGVLSTLKECRVDAKSKNNFLIIKIHLCSAIKEIVPVIFVPSIQESSPALAFV